jgi:hypothetical protein
MLVRFVGDRMTLFSSLFLIKYPWFYSETAFLMSMTSLPSGPGPKGPPHVLKRRKDCCRPTGRESGGKTVWDSQKDFLNRNL